MGAILCVKVLAKVGHKRLNVAAQPGDTSSSWMWSMTSHARVKLSKVKGWKVCAVLLGWLLGVSWILDFQGFKV
jgi:hypothetical protein